MAGDDDIPILAEDDLDRISRMLDAFESGRLNPSVPAPSRRPPLAPIETRIGQASSDIPALTYGNASGSGSGAGGNMPIPGSGTVKPYYLDQTDTPNPLVWTGEDDYPVFNLFPEKVYSGEWVGMIRDPISGQYFVVFPGQGQASSSSSASSMSSAMSSASGSTSGNGVVVVTEVDCSSGGLHVVDGVLTGYVTIGGTNYPITFSIGSVSQ